MAYPSHYTAVVTRLRQVQAAVERELETATGERRALVVAVQERAEAALRSPLLLIDRGFAGEVAAHARADQDALGCST